jgi:hypothetical protein
VQRRFGEANLRLPVPPPARQRPVSLPRQPIAARPVERELVTGGCAQGTAGSSIARVRAWIIPSVGPSTDTRSMVRVRLPQVPPAPRRGETLKSSFRPRAIHSSYFAPVGLCAAFRSLATTSSNRYGPPLASFLGSIRRGLNTSAAWVIWTFSAPILSDSDFRKAPCLLRHTMTQGAAPILGGQFMWAMASAKRAHLPRAGLLCGTCRRLVNPTLISAVLPRGRSTMLYRMRR